MGSKYEVYGWRHVGYNPDRFQEVCVYHGNSVIKALYLTMLEKRRSSYVRFEWR